MAGQDSKAGQEGWGRIDQGQAAWRDRTARQDKKAGEGQIRAKQHGRTGQRDGTGRLGRIDQGPAAWRDRTARQDKKAGEGQIRTKQHGGTGQQGRTGRPGRIDQGQAAWRDRTARQDKKAGEGQIRTGNRRKDFTDLTMTSYGLAHKCVATYLKGKQLIHVTLYSQNFGLLKNLKVAKKRLHASRLCEPFMEVCRKHAGFYERRLLTICMTTEAA
jgi:hypothetical protein